MRALTLLALTTALLIPALASADPAQPQSPPAANAEAMPATTAPSQATAPQMSAPASAAAPATSSDVMAGVDLDAIVCRSTPPPTGSRLGGGRECHTVRQWNDRQRQEQQMLETQQRMNSRQGG
jgi:hypothetical protein